MKILYYALVLLFSVTLWGCSSGNSAVPAAIDPTTGKHVAGWAANGSGGAHPDVYFSNPNGCKECHGTDLKGGISQVSCSNPGRSGVLCHSSFPHVLGFKAFALHGNSAKAQALGVTGMAHCQKCHGTIYTGNGAAPNCIGCHQQTNPASNAPHAANWVSGNANGLKHSTTDPSNAPACAQCHLGGSFSHPAPVPAAAGTAPQCFNGTLCHNAAGHAFTVVDHMVSARSNLASCQTCHATPSAGSNPRFTIEKNATLTPGGCEKCHAKPGLAHPFMWLPGRPRTLEATNTASHANAQNVVASCGLCHGGAALTGGGTAYPGGIAPPACFSTPGAAVGATACHFTKPINAQGITVGCSSCHGAAPTPLIPSSGQPIGSTAPNRDFRHSKHFNAITGLTCGICHNGFGTGKVSHSARVVFAAVTAPVAILQTGPAQFNDGGPAAYNTSTQKCTNVSCHGGSIGGDAFLSIPNMDWKKTGSLIATDCATNCHVVSQVEPALYSGVPYIGPFSGNNIVPTILNGLLNHNNLHQFHMNQVLTLCTDCHNVSAGKHFQNILTGRRTLTQGFAVGTIGGPSTGVLTYTNINATTSSCIVAGTSPSWRGCHSGLPGRSWYK